MREKLRFAELSLRPLTTNDREITLAWRNQPTIRASMYTTHEISPDEHERWLKRVISSSDCSYHIVEYCERAVGTVGFYGISDSHRRGEWTFYVGETSAPLGIGRPMLFLAADFFFGDLGLRKLCGEAISSNQRSIRLHEWFGFRLEGVRQRHYWRDGQPLDVMMFALFDEDWHVLRQQHFRALFV